MPKSSRSHRSWQNNPDRYSQPVSDEEQTTQKRSGNNLLWIVGTVLVIGVIAAIAGTAYYIGQKNANNSYGQTTNNTSNNNISPAGNTTQQQSADPSQIQGIIQQFCNDVVSKDYQSAWGLLSQNEQYNEKDVSGLVQHLTSDFDTNYHQQHPSVGGISTGSYSAGTYTVTGCTTNGDPLITQGSGSIPTTAMQHFTWSFSDNAQTTGQFELVYEDGSWKIKSFNVDLS